MQGRMGPSPGQLNTLSPQPLTWAVTSASGRGQYGGMEAEVVAATVDQTRTQVLPGLPDCHLHSLPRAKTAATGGGDGTGKAAPSQGALRALIV